MLLIKDLHKYYKSANGEGHHALKGINLSLEEKGFVFILGKSGSGKSTLLNILGGLDYYDKGEIIIKNRHTQKFKHREWDSFRNTYVGFVFQEFYMIDSYTIGKNIAISLELQGYPKNEIKERVEEILKRVGLEGYAKRKPSEISGGQKQRIAIARALIKNPRIILADEPTGNLDSKTGKSILEMLKELSKEKLVIMVTHDTSVARTYGDRIIELKDGIIISDGSSNDHEEFIYENINEDIQSLIHFPKGNHLNQPLIQYLHQHIDKQNEDTYIILTTDHDFVNSKTPNLKLKEKINSYKESNVIENTYDEPFNLRKSKLPYKNTLKLAFSNIMLKKFRFALITLLFIISLVFVGFASMFSNFDFTSVSNSTFKNGDVKYIGFTKQTEYCFEEDLCEEIQLNINQSDIEELKNEFPSIQFTTTRSEEITLTPLTKRYDKYYTNSLNKVTIIDNEDMFTLMKGKYPSEVGEILISDFMASMITKYRMFGIKPDMNSLLGDWISINQNVYYIVGFVKTDYSKFKKLEGGYIKERFEEVNYFEIRDNLYRHMYMTQETYDLTLNRTSNKATFDFNNNHHLVDMIMKVSHENYKPDLIGRSRLPILNNEIVLPASQAFEHFLMDLSYFSPNNENLLALIGKSFDLTFTLSNSIPPRTYTIVGIYDDITNGKFRYYRNSSEWIGTKEEVEIIDELTFPYKNSQANIMGYALLGEDQDENERFVNQLMDQGWIHATEYSKSLYQINDSITKLSGLLYVIGGMVTIFTSLMIFMFISASIHKKQKEIGILRAIGARGIDVSKIYIFEGLLIGIISSVLANIILVQLVKLINYVLTKNMNIDLIILNFGKLNMIIVFSLALIVVSISSFLPVRRITVMKPIKAIKSI